jgi:hypothetical protein
MFKNDVYLCEHCFNLRFAQWKIFLLLESTFYVFAYFLIFLPELNVHIRSFDSSKYQIV